MTTAFGAKAPQYSTVLELDRRIRDFPTPWRFRVKCAIQEDEEPGKAVHMQRWFVMSCKEISEAFPDSAPLLTDAYASTPQPSSTLLRSGSEYDVE